MLRRNRNILARVSDAARKQFGLDLKGAHGISHWERVRQNGHLVAKSTGINPLIVDLFAFLHDSCREDDGHDHGHGERAATFTKSLRGSVFQLEDDEFLSLFEAIRDHELGYTTGDLIKQTCWDADRLDLGRVGIRPNPKYLCTPMAKRPETIAQAMRRSKSL
jgi:uncharacterized protein